MITSESHPLFSRSLKLILVGLSLVLLFYLGRNYYLLFHSFAELFSIGVIYSLFILAWNTRRFHENGFLLFVAVALVFNSNLDLVHTLAYKGMNLLPISGGANTATQLWIAARYMQAVSLLIAPFYFKRKIRLGVVTAVFVLVELLIFASIFWWNIFPVCYIDGAGLTPFKIISEFVIIAIYVAALAHFYLRRADIQARIYTYMSAMLVVSILAEAAFTSYIGVFDFANWLGHILKIVSFYLVYKAIVETGLERPVELLFAKLQQSQSDLLKSHQELEIRVAERTAELQAQIAERRKAEEKIANHAVRTEGLAEISHLMMAAPPGGDPPLVAIADTLISCLGDGSVIRLLTPDHCFLEAAAIQHTNPEKQRQMENIFQQIPIVPGRDLIGQIFTKGQAVLYQEIPYEDFAESYGEDRSDQLKLLGFNSMIVAPMQVREEKIGSITLFRDEQHSQYSVEDQVLVEAVANRIALAMSNQRLYENLQKSLAEEQNMRNRLIQSEKHSAIARMIASIAHELNNPIQTIQNCMFLLQLHADHNQKLEQYLSMATRETERIAKLVSQLREVYRPRRDRPREVIVVDHILNEVHQLLEPHLAHNKVDWVELCSCAEGETYYRINALPDQIKQVFLNLCLNAIEAMQPGGGVLYIDKVLSPDKSLVGMVIQDTGPGIPPDYLPSIFDPFYTTKEMGTGLGLSISMEIVVNHGGSIVVESQPGRGAKFTVWLPLVGELEPVS